MALISPRMIQLLDDSQQRNSLVAVHLDPDESYRFVLGTVFALGEDLLGLRQVDLSGRFDGFAVTPLEQIARISRNGPYIDKVQSFIDLALFPPDPPVRHLDMPEILQLLESTAQAVSFVDRYRTTTSGFLIGSDDTAIEMRTYTPALQYDGDEVIPLDELRKLEFGGPDQTLLNSISVGGLGLKGR